MLRADVEMAPAERRRTSGSGGAVTTTRHPVSPGDVLTWMVDDCRVNMKRAGLLSAIAVVSFRLRQYGHHGTGLSAGVVRWLALPLAAFSRLLLGVELPARLLCGRRLVLPHGGRGVVVSPDASLGDDVCLMHQVTVGNAAPHRSAPVIGDNVFVGVKASVLGGVVVGDGAVIGAHALVTRDVPPGVLALGVPATGRGPAPVFTSATRQLRRGTTAKERAAVALYDEESAP